MLYTEPFRHVRTTNVLVGCNKELLTYLLYLHWDGKFTTCQHLSHLRTKLGGDVRITTDDIVVGTDEEKVSMKATRRVSQ